MADEGLLVLHIWHGIDVFKLQKNTVAAFGVSTLHLVGRSKWGLYLMAPQVMAAMTTDLH